MSILVKKFQQGNKVDLLTKTNQFVPNSIKPDTVVNDGRVKEIPVNYNKESEEVVGNKIRTYYSTQANEPKVSVVPPKNKIIPATNVTPNPEAYKKIIQDRLNKGEKLQDLINKGVVSVEGAKQFIQPFEVKRKVYTETEIPVVTKPAAVADSSRTPVQMIQDRKQVFGNKAFESFDYPDSHAGYSQSTRVHFDPVTKKEIDPLKSFDEKGNYKPFFIENSNNDYYKNTRKFEIPGTNSNAKNLDINEKPVETGYKTTAFKKGGVVKKKMKKCLCGCVLYKKKKSKK